MWATADDVIADWIGEDVPTNKALVSRWVARAERYLRREIPSLQARIEEGAEPDLRETVVDVISAMVARVFRNPEGIRQRQETDGSFTGSITFAGDTPGELFLTDRERDSLLAPQDRKGAQAAFTFGPDNYAGGGHRPWCSLMFGAKYCSCGVDIAGQPIFEES
ncbi:Gp19/Gp15/Gp42 family protein [Trueperella pyogenes]|uniref:Gp19/Gp15/Gp42 family protein n=1 Tax=Trueperella pyogenes TaxID=1661 RepID=UPI0032557A3C